MDAALAVADRDGFDAGTIRARAAEVGVPHITLYTQFKDKAALRDGMRERAFEQIVAATISSKSSRQDALAEIARNSRAVLRAHPNSCATTRARAGSPSMSTIGQWSFDEVLELGIRSLVDGIENLRRQPTSAGARFERNSERSSSSSSSPLALVVGFTTTTRWNRQHLLRVVQERRRPQPG